MNLRAMFIAAAVAAALALAGCGGGDDNSGSTAASTGTSGAETSPAPSGQQKSATSGASKGSFTFGSPADVPRTEGGDNSIQDFGSQASGADRAAAAQALAAYFGALAKGNTEQGCALLSSATQQGIEQTLKQLPTQGGTGKIPTTCPQILKLTLDPRSPQLRLSEVLTLRRQGQRAFLIYKAGDGKVYAMPMSDNGGWRVSGVSAAPLGA